MINIEMARASGPNIHSSPFPLGLDQQYHCSAVAKVRKLCESAKALLVNLETDLLMSLALAVFT